MKLLITGATGYIGERLARLAFREGHTVYSASRKQTDTHYYWLPFDLKKPTLDIPDETRALVHLAADTTHNKNISSETEVQAARELIRNSALTNTKLIFISSQTASPDAPTSYGQTKWRIEQDVIATGGVVIRPGQVYGGYERGLFGVLSSLVRRFPLIPALIPTPLIQPIHVDDLAVAILTVAAREDIRGEIFCLGSVRPISFSAFLESIATNRLNVLRIAAPLPVPLITLARAMLGKRRTAQLGLDRLLSLLTLKSMSTQTSLQRLGITLRPLAYGMHRSGNGRRRHLLVEGNILLSYLLKSPPGQSLLRRYARAIEALGNGQAILDSKLLSLFPSLLALIDNPSFLCNEQGKALSWRLHLAMTLAEASPQGAVVFLGLKRSGGFLRTFIALGMSVLKEVCWRTLALLTKPLLSNMLIKRKSPRDA
ncbi:sugar nucleotide-binding protein [Pseudomonas sp. N-137]|uniref:NAD-dependent epimerase/dehydratase family protein n=1 Tax=Pseudomonas sp. N-137 TaxID=3108452 RepID=UPI002ADED52F|nr:sugar nucleotide-binding protein [Pseudomonas sp. N-137]MEA1031750.1 sugar nucleotide-binding protein [Pseudomonas sp. N-137]